MSDSKEPKKPRIEILAEQEIGKPAEESKADEVRVQAEVLLEAPKLPPEFVDQLMEADMRDAEGKDLKKAALLMCSNIDMLLERISRIPELNESAQILKLKLQRITGMPLYEQIECVLEELSDLAELVIKKTTHPERGTSYLQNTQDGLGTPRVDLEYAMRTLEKMRPLHEELRSLGDTEQYQERSAEVQRRMDAGDTQLMARFKMQKNLEGQITHALEQGEITEETARLILFATSGQMNMGFNTVGQVGNQLSIRLDEDDLGESQAERQTYLLNIYWQLLAVTEGVRFLQRFYR